MKKILSLAVLPCLLGLSPAFGDEPGWSLRLDGYYVDPGETPSVSFLGIANVRSDNTSGGGLGVSAEYRFNERIGLELGALATNHGDFFVVIDPPGTRLKVDDTLTMQVFSAGVNVYLTPRSKVDLYVGGLLAIVGYTNLTVDVDLDLPSPLPGPTSVRIDIESDLGFGLNLGLDVPLGDRGWIFNANLRYLLTTADASIEGLISEAIDYDPLLVGAGFGYRF
jgi:outer membrane protein